MFMALILGILIGVVVGLLILGNEVARLASTPRVAVLELEEATYWIAERLPEATQARISHDDLRWILLADAEGLEASTKTPLAQASSESEESVFDEDVSVARVLAKVEETNRDLEDNDVAAVIYWRMRYLEDINAVGPKA